MLSRVGTPLFFVSVANAGFRIAASRLEATLTRRLTIVASKRLSQHQKGAKHSSADAIVAELSVSRD